MKTEANEPVNLIDKDRVLEILGRLINIAALDHSHGEFINGLIVARDFITLLKPLINEPTKNNTGVVLRTARTD